MYMTEVEQLLAIFTSWGVCDDPSTDYCTKCLVQPPHTNCLGTTIKDGKVLEINTENLSNIGYIINNNKTKTLSDIQLLSNLTSLRIDAGEILTGEIPNSIGNLTGLNKLYLGANHLTGEIPKGITNLTGLQELHLGSNHLTGEIPKGITNLTGLQELHLWTNQLTGEIPKGITNLTGLQWLHLGSNHLTGEIPKGITNLTGLQLLQLNDNQLTGGIPDTIGNLTGLYTLLLNDNYLTVSTSFLSNLSNLTNLSVSDPYYFSINKNCNKSCSLLKYCTPYSPNRPQLTELKVYGITLNENELIINYAYELRQACAN